MSKCTVRIVLDRTDLTYCIGDTVNCTVYVSVDKSVDCKSLQLTRYWKTHGRGNRDSGGKSEVTLFAGKWLPGEYQYPYSFVIDQGPVSYHGKIVNVDWYLKVQADIPWALDPKDETEFIVEKRRNHVADEPLLDMPPHADLTAQLDDAGMPPELRRFDMAKLQKWLALMPLIFAVIGGGMIYSAYSDKDIINGLMGGAFLCIGLVATFQFWRNSLAERKLGKVKLQLHPQRLRPGQRCKLGVAFIVQEAVELNQISVTLVGTEVAVSGSGTRQTTHTHVFHNQTFGMRRDAMLSAGRPIMDEMELMLPGNAPPSFYASDNRVEWQAKVTIDIKNWPDWSEAQSIEVLP